MYVKTKINYYVSAPDGDPSGQKYRIAGKTVQLWLQEATQDKLIPAFIVGEQTFYWYQKKLWCKIRYDETEETAVEAFHNGCKKGKLTKPESPTDTYSVMYERASALINKRLACDGEMYVVTGEPYYCLHYNIIFSQSNGKLISYVSTHHGDQMSALEKNSLRFNALEWDLMQKYIRVTKAVMRDNVTVQVNDRIQVLLPEAVKIPPAEDLTKTEDETVEEKKRIICDYYQKGMRTPLPGGNIVNRELTAVNDLYGWLYRNCILMQHAFIARDYDNTFHFAIDAKSLEPYRTAMLASGVPDAELAVEILLDRDITPCMYTGAITLSCSMATFRGTDDIVSRSWECYMVQTFDAENANKFLEIFQREGAEAAVAAMYADIEWKPDYISAKNPGSHKKLI